MNITVIGAGNTGLAMAAHAAAEGHHVTLWNRNKQNISKLMDSRTIYSNGEVDGQFKLDLVTSDIKEALKDPDLILITTPSFAHKELAEKIAKNIAKQTIILLCPGRTFGALEFKDVYKEFNSEYEQTVAETQTAVYTCRKTSEDAVDILSIKNNVLFSAVLAEENARILEQLPKHLQKHLTPANSLVETSIGNVGLVLHCTPLLLNTGWTESKKHTYKYYIEGISPSIAKFLEKMDAERIEVSKRLGVEVESVKDWLRRVYKVEGDSLYESIQNTEPYVTIEAPNTLDNRYITEDVPNGLVPLESTGKHLGLEMKYTGIIIDLASALLERDFREEGRNLNSIFKEDNMDIERFLNGSDD